MSACPGISAESAFLTGMLDYVDCQAQEVGSGGYHALAAQGSPVSLALGAMLTLFIALFGFRMLFGQVPSARDATVAVVKLGFVLALATSWPAFQTLAYDVALHGPAELAAGIGGSSGLPGAGGGLVAHLQSIDDALIELDRLGAGHPTDLLRGVEQNAPLMLPQQQQQSAQPGTARPRWDPTRDAQLLGQGRIAYLTATIGAFASVRLVAGFLLAIAPLFVAFLLFDATRGLFEGWLRALIGAALGALSTAIILGVQLALMEPWLRDVLAERYADIATLAVPVELVVMTWVFGLTLLAALIACARVAHGLRLPDAAAKLSHWIGDRTTGLPSLVSLPSDRAAPAGAIDRSRAQAIADAAQDSHWREASGLRSPAVQLIERGGNPQTPARGSEQPWITPIGQSARRRTGGRVSAGHNRRDAI